MKPKPMRVCFVGNMLGKNAGYITTQGQIVAELLGRDENFEIFCVSPKINRALRFVEIVWTLLWRGRNFDAAVVEVYSGMSFRIAEAASLICGVLRLPLALFLHGGNLPEYAARYPQRTKRVFRRAAFIVAPSAFLADEFGKSGFDVRVIPNVLELENYPFRHRERISPRLLWMRSFHEIYNPQMAIETLAQLKKNYPSATLVMAGKDKGLENEIKKLASEKTPGAVRFAGFLDAEKKQEEFALADVFINTNRIDNMPVAILEAAACGLPIVATRVGGLPFLISDGENGLLCESENPKSMADAVGKILSDAELARKISAGGRRLAERSAWTRVKQDWENLFAEIKLQGGTAKKNAILLNPKRDLS